MINYRKTMDAHLDNALNAFNHGDINAGLSEIAMSLQDMSCRLDVLEKRVGVSYLGELTEVPLSSAAT